MKILITGGAGFIGSHIVDLLKTEHEICVLDDLSTGRKENLCKTDQYGVEMLRCDIVRYDELISHFFTFRPEVVIHMAAQGAISKSWQNPRWDGLVNVMGTINVAEAAHQTHVKRIVHASTSAVYDEACLGKIMEVYRTNPRSPYGVSKLAAESYMRLLFPKSVILRLGNVYGPRQVPLGGNQVIPRMIKHFEKGDDFCIHGDGEQKRDFIYVGDVACAFAHAIEGQCGTYNIATGIPRSVNQIAEMVEDIYGVKGYKWTHSDEQDPRREVCLDVERAKFGLDWVPYHTLKEGLTNTIDWWKNH